MTGGRYPEKLSAVVWDFDDTLADSMDARVNALRRVFGDTDIVGVDPLDFLLHLPETNFELSLIGLSEKLGKPSDLFERYKSLYWTKAQGLLRMYPGVHDLLQRLESQSIPQGLVTQKARPFHMEGVAAGVAVEVEELGLTSMYSVVVGIDDVQETKPHPEGILMALERIGVQPENALMVGDTVTDIEAARAAGCWSCLATWGVPDGASRAARSNPDFVMESPSGLLTLPFARQA
jgi:pyrophosphatase PpaX